MKKSLPKPTACLLLRLRHPALRQVACPVCQSAHVNFELHNTVVVDGPRKHPALGPIAGSILTMIGHCAKGHCFLVRLANHKDKALFWTDVTVEVEVKDAKTKVKGDYDVFGPSIMDAASPNDPSAKVLDEAEELPVPGDISDASDTLFKGAKVPPPNTPGHTEEDCKTCNDPSCPKHPKHAKADDLCHAGMSVSETLEVLNDTSILDEGCVTCPNLQCPVSLRIQALLVERNNNYIASYSTDPDKAPSAPHEEFKSIAQASKKLKPPGALKLTTLEDLAKAIKEAGKVHPFKAKTAPPVIPPTPAEAAAILKAKTEELQAKHAKTVVDGCPDRLTYGQAGSPKCQEDFCASCTVTTCVMHPNNKPKV